MKDWTKARTIPPALLESFVDLLRNSGRTVESIMVGNSMSPSIPNGSHIRIKCGRSHQQTVGGVVVYFRNGHPVTCHRVVGWGRRKHVKDFVVTRGDGNLVCDVPTPRSTVLGVVTEFCLGEEWHPVPTHRRAGPVHRAMAATLKATTLLALDVHPNLAHCFALTMVRLAHITRLSLRKVGIR
jgi:hypothetical protein